MFHRDFTLRHRIGGKYITTTTQSRPFGPRLRSYATCNVNSNGNVKSGRLYAWGHVGTLMSLSIDLSAVFSAAAVAFATSPHACLANLNFCYEPDLIKVL